MFWKKNEIQKLRAENQLLKLDIMNMRWGYGDFNKSECQQIILESKHLSERTLAEKWNTSQYYIRKVKKDGYGR